MKRSNGVKQKAMMDTFVITFLFFLAGCLFCIFTLTSNQVISLPLMMSCGIILGLAGGAYNYFFWMQNGRGAFRSFF